MKKAHFVQVEVDGKWNTIQKAFIRRMFAQKWIDAQRKAFNNPRNYRVVRMSFQEARVV